MRPISVLNVEGRIFFSCVHFRLAPFIVNNRYINIREQKAFIDGIAGCIEQGTLVYEAIKYAIQHQSNITIAWLDLANAYGSVRHMLMAFALAWYHVPFAFRNIMFTYYEGLSGQIDTSSWSSNRFWLAKGLFQGCTLSTDLFKISFPYILDIHTVLANKYVFNMAKAEVRVLHPTFADDVALATSSPTNCTAYIRIFHKGLKWSICFV